MSALKRALFFLNHHRPADAEKELRGWLASHPQDDRALAFLARALMIQGRHDEAFAAACEALAIDPNDDYNHRTHARMLQQADRMEEAIDAVTEAIQLAPEDPRNYYLKAIFLLTSGRIIQGFEVITQALSFDPDNADFLAVRATALNAMGRAAEAFETASAALKKEPDHAGAHAELGWAELERNHPQNAEASFVESLRLDPTHYRAKKGLIESLKYHIPPYRWTKAALKRLATTRWLEFAGAYFVLLILISFLPLPDGFRATGLLLMSPLLFLGLGALLGFLTLLTTPLTARVLQRVHPLTKHLFN